MSERPRPVIFRGYWCAYWREDGQPRRHSLRLKETQPRAEAQRVLDVWWREQQRPDDPTIDALWEAYVADYEGRPIAERMKPEWAVMAPFFGGIYPSQITPELVREHIAVRRARGISDGTLWTELGHLRQVMSWAVEHGMIDRAPYIDRPAKPDPRNRILSRDEVAALIEACEADHVRLFVILALSTAGRRGALLELTWDRVDFSRNQIALATGDGGRRKGRATVPMTATLRAALSTAYTIRTCDHVIEYGTKPVRSIKTGFNAACRRANLTDVTIHDLRHTCAVRMAEGGSSMARIAQVLGHSDSRLTERVYARFAPDHLVDDVAHLDLACTIEPGARLVKKC